MEYEIGQKTIAILESALAQDPRAVAALTAFADAIGLEAADLVLTAKLRTRGQVADLNSATNVPPEAAQG